MPAGIFDLHRLDGLHTKISLFANILFQKPTPRKDTQDNYKKSKITIYES